MKKSDMWVDKARPDQTNLIPNPRRTILVNGIEKPHPVTHLANHPQIGGEEILELTKGKATTVGLDWEGVGESSGSDEISDETLEWLKNEQARYELGKFVVSNCRNYVRVQYWRQQMEKNGLRIPIFSPHVLKYEGSFGTEAKVDRSIKKPARTMYNAGLAATRCDDPATQAVFVGDKFSDLIGAQAAGIGIRVLVPRLGEEDHILDKLWTRGKQRREMEIQGMVFPTYEAPAATQASAGGVHPPIALSDGIVLVQQEESWGYPWAD